MNFHLFFIAIFLCITYSMCTSEHVNIIVFLFKTHFKLTLFLN